MTGRIDSLKAVKEIDAKISDVDARIDRHTAGMTAAVAAHDQAVAAWRERISTGFGDGTVSDEPQPEKPEALRMAADHLARLRRERETLQRERLEVIAAHGQEILELVSQDVQKTLGKAAPILDSLQQHLDAVSRSQRDVTSLVDAVNATSARGILQVPPPTTITLDLLAAACQDGIDPISAERSTAEKVLGLRVERPASGGSESGWRSSEDTAEERQRRDAALASQEQQLLGRRAPRPLGYRSGGA